MPEFIVFPLSAPPTTSSHTPVNFAAGKNPIGSNLNRAKVIIFVKNEFKTLLYCGNITKQ